VRFDAGLSVLILHQLNHDFELLGFCIAPFCAKSTISSSNHRHAVTLVTGMMTVPVVNIACFFLILSIPTYANQPRPLYKQQLLPWLCASCIHVLDHKQVKSYQHLVNVRISYNIFMTITILIWLLDLSWLKTSIRLLSQALQWIAAHHSCRLHVPCW
jgi:hypothetical protein